MEFIQNSITIIYSGYILRRLYMKIKFKKVLSILTLTILMVTGCNSNTNDKSISSKDKEDKIKVVTSFYPMYLLTSNVVKDIDNVELINMTDSSTGCLHDYSLTTDNVRSEERRVGKECKSKWWWV